MQIFFIGITCTVIIFPKIIKKEIYNYLHASLELILICVLLLFSVIFLSVVLLKTWSNTQRNVAWHTGVLCEMPLLSLPRAAEADLTVPPGPAALGVGLRDFSRETPRCYPQRSVQSQVKSPLFI